ncbi:MAG: hypothetical protein AAF471_05460 [Myxococcota bacterium]
MTDERYRAAYAPLLREHMSLGHSVESFAALKKDGKKAVSRATVERWLKRHASFARAFEEGEAAALLFFERRLLAGMESGKNRVEARAAAAVLSKRFADVWGTRSSSTEPRDGSEEKRMDIREINDPEELLRLIRSLESKSEKQHAAKHLRLLPTKT